MQLPAIVRRKKRIGRGIAGGGAKSGRGMKGQRSRAGAQRQGGFEGGQTPLYQRLPKERGSQQIFSSQAVRPFALTVAMVNSFDEAVIIGPGQLRAAGLIDRTMQVKLIGRGPVAKKVTVRVHQATAGARQAVEAAGGIVELITGEHV